MENETTHHLLTDCDALYDLQMSIIGDMKIDTDHTWSIKQIMMFLCSPTINSLLSFNTSYAEKEIIYQEHNYSSNSSNTS